MKQEAVLLLGSNLGDRVANLKKAIFYLKSKGVEVVKQSALYESDAVGYDSPNSYYNIAVKVDFTCSPQELLQGCLSVEQELGRERKKGVRYSDRTMDIDIILIKDTVINSSDLMVPHPRMHLRKFCLVPVSEVVPSWPVTTSGKTVSEVLGELSNKEKISRLDVEI